MEAIPESSFKSLFTDILISIDKWCSTNGVRYSLALGTLIGAVRHKGFIPWDDDIDIWMPRPDYEKFIRYFDSEWHKVISYKNTPGYPLEYAKVHDCRTVVFEAGENVGWGISVDVFPVDGIPSLPEAPRIMERVTNARHLLANQRFTYKLKPSKSAGFRKNISILAGKLIHPMIPLHKVVGRVDAAMSKSNYNQCDHIADLCDLKPAIVEKSFMEDFVDLEFEGHTFKATAHYDSWLRKIYGDYH